MLSACLSQQAAAVPVRTAVCPQTPLILLCAEGTGIVPWAAAEQGQAGEEQRCWWEAGGFLNFGFVAVCHH